MSKGDGCVKMDTEQKAIIVFGIALIVIGSFWLGVQFGSYENTMNTIATVRSAKSIVPNITTLNTYILWRGNGAITYNGISMSYDGQEVHLYDGKDNFMDFCLTITPSDMNIDYRFTFLSHNFKITYWGSDYVEIMVLS
jgi:hypothetical protein